MSAVHPRALDYADSKLDGMIPDESELTAGTRIEPGKSYGFFTDTTLCIGCKACEVACKEWNALPADDVHPTGMSYDNTGRLGANTWRHVAFIEKISEDGERATEMAPFQSNWLMMSDVCKHCDNAPCQEACPTGALFRTEFDTVVVQQDICNGCGYCVPACPFGVIDLSPFDGKAHKCTLSYDRMKGGWSRPAPRPARPIRSSSANCPNFMIARTSASPRCTSRVPRTPMSMGRREPPAPPAVSTTCTPSSCSLTDLRSTTCRRILGVARRAYGRGCCRDSPPPFS
jgi:Fe-S-cluster-containing dehydrogenase component